MHFRLYYSLCCLLFFLTCQKTVSKYELPEEILTKVLADIHISEAAIQHLSLELKDSMAQVYYEQIIEIHGVDQALFEKDFQQLKQDPEKLAKVYDKVIKQLNEIKSKRNKKK